MSPTRMFAVLPTVICVAPTALLICEADAPGLSVAHTVLRTGMPPETPAWDQSALRLALTTVCCAWAASAHAMSASPKKMVLTRMRSPDDSEIRRPCRSGSGTGAVAVVRLEVQDVVRLRSRFITDARRDLIRVPSIPRDISAGYIRTDRWPGNRSKEGRFRCEVKRRR